MQAMTLRLRPVRISETGAKRVSIAPRERSGARDSEGDLIRGVQTGVAWGGKVTRTTGRKRLRPWSRGRAIWWADGHDRYNSGPPDRRAPAAIFSGNFSRGFTHVGADRSRTGDGRTAHLRPEP